MVAAALVDSSVSPLVVCVQDVSKRYGRIEAVRGVGFDVRPGEIYGLIGPDGAGKSTLLKIAAGVLAFDTGRIDVLGARIDSERAAERVKSRLGFMPQGLGRGLYPELSVEENVEFFADLSGVTMADRVERARELLAVTGLRVFGARPAKHLSGGMQQKLGLVCTLIHQPELVILDEPTTGVDPLSRRDFWAVLNQLVRERGMTALVSTAYLDEASRFDRLSLVFEGRELAKGTPAELSALAHDGEPGLEGAFVSLLHERGVTEKEASERAASATPERAPAETAIDARELTRDFGPFRAVDGVSFEVKSGEIFGLLGANGAGKTTVIKLLTGILAPSSGAGRVAGIDMRRAGANIKQHIGYVSQAFSLYSDLTILENLRFYAGVYGLSSAETRRRTEWVIELGGLAHYLERRAGSAPPGVRQRLALSCALLHQPHVLFLDEPTSGVDPLGRRRFWSILVKLAREDGVAVLVTTHHMAEAERCDRVALLFGGRIAVAGEPPALRRALASDAGQLFEFSTDQPYAALLRVQLAGLGGAALFGSTVRAFSRNPELDLTRVRDALAASGITLHRTREVSPSMEDVFLFHIGELERRRAANESEHVV
jgi:ABC-2 type transport system ATP-binding protein